MDSVNEDGTSISAEEDRLSSLPDDIIYHILGFLDMKYAVQTSALSWKWKNIWTLMPQLNFNSHAYGGMNQFFEFVKHALSHRNNSAEVSAVDLTCTGSPSDYVVQRVVRYAYLNNVRKMTLKWSGGTGYDVPTFFFSSHTLKYLTLYQESWQTVRSRISIWDFDFPALETLNLRNIRLGDVNCKSLNLFSKCVNLKHLTLQRCSMYGLESFDVNAPQLSDLTITGTVVFPMIFNVVSSQLKNLTASIIASGANQSCSRFLRLSAEGFNSIEKVNLSLSNDRRYKKEKVVPPLLDLFPIFCNANFVILDVDIIEFLSSCLDQLSHEPCPFNNVKCLKIDRKPLRQNDRIPTIYRKPLHQNDRITTIPTQVRNYFLENSPNATFIMELPQAKQTESMTEEKPRENVEMQDQAIAKQKENVEMQDQVLAKQKENVEMHDQVISKLKEKIQLQDQVIGNLKAKLRARNLRLGKLITQILNYKIVELKVQVESGNPDYKAICSIGRDIKDSIPRNLRANVEAQFSSKYQEVKSLLLTRIDASQWSKIETLLGSFWHSQSFCSNKSHSQSAARSAELFPAPRSSSADVPQKIRWQQVPNGMMAKKVMEETKETETIAQEKQKGKMQMQDQIIAKQKVKIQMPDQVIGKLKVRLAAQNLHHEKLISQIIKCKMAELKVQVDTGNPDYEVIRSIGRDIKDLISGSLRVNVEAQVYSQYQEVKSQLLTRINASQWAIIEILLGNVRHFERFPSGSSHSRPAVHAAELPPAPRSYSANVPMQHKRSRQQVPDDMTANKAAKAGKKQTETPLQEKRILETKVRMQEQLLAQQNASLQVQYQVAGQQMAKIQMQEQIIAGQNASLQVQFQVTGQQLEKIQKQDQAIRKFKDLLGERNLQHEKMISQIIKCKVAELKVQVESGNPDYQVIGLIGRDIKDLIPGSLRVNVKELFFSLYEEAKSLLLKRITANQWAKIEIFLGNMRHSEKLHFSNSHCQSAVSAAELPPAPRPS